MKLLSLLCHCIPCNGKSKRQTIEDSDRLEDCKSSKGKYPSTEMGEYGEHSELQRLKKVITSVKLELEQKILKQLKECEESVRALEEGTAATRDTYDKKSVVVQETNHSREQERNTGKTYFFEMGICRSPSEISKDEEKTVNEQPQQSLQDSEPLGVVVVDHGSNMYPLQPDVSSPVASNESLKASLIRSGLDLPEELERRTENETFLKKGVEPVFDHTTEASQKSSIKPRFLPLDLIQEDDTRNHIDELKRYSRPNLVEDTEEKSYALTMSSDAEDLFSSGYPFLEYSVNSESDSSNASEDSVISTKDSADLNSGENSQGLEKETDAASVISSLKHLDSSEKFCPKYEKESVSVSKEEIQNLKKSKSVKTCQSAVRKNSPFEIASFEGINEPKRYEDCSNSEFLKNVHDISSSVLILDERSASDRRGLMNSEAECIETELENIYENIGKVNVIEKVLVTESYQMETNEEFEVDSVVSFSDTRCNYSFTTGTVVEQLQCGGRKRKSVSEVLKTENSRLEHENYNFETAVKLETAVDDFSNTELENEDARMDSNDFSDAELERFDTRMDCESDYFSGAERETEDARLDPGCVGTEEVKLLVDDSETVKGENEEICPSHYNTTEEEKNEMLCYRVQGSPPKELKIIFDDVTVILTVQLENDNTLSQKTSNSDSHFKKGNNNTDIRLATSSGTSDLGIYSKPDNHKEDGIFPDKISFQSNPRNRDAVCNKPWQRSCVGSTDSGCSRAGSLLFQKSSSQSNRTGPCRKITSVNQQTVNITAMLQVTRPSKQQDISRKLLSSRENISKESQKSTPVIRDWLKNVPSREREDRKTNHDSCIDNYISESDKVRGSLVQEREQSFSTATCELNVQNNYQQGNTVIEMDEFHSTVACSNGEDDAEREVLLSKNSYKIAENEAGQDSFLYSDYNKSQVDIDEDGTEDQLSHVVRTVSSKALSDVYWQVLLKTASKKKRQVKRKQKKFTKLAGRRRRLLAGETCSLNRHQPPSDTLLDNSSLYPGSSTRKRNTPTQQPRHLQHKTKQDCCRKRKKKSGSKSTISQFSTLKKYTKCISNVKDSGICMSFTSSISFELVFWQFCQIFCSIIKKRQTQMKRLQFSLKVDKTEKETKDTNSKHRNHRRKFFEKKSRMSTKEIARELHVQHGISFQVFGLGSYFDQLNRGEVLSLHECMRYEWLRLHSFQHYQGAGNALALARNGFYHDPADGSTSTRCYLCEAAYSDWQLFQNVEERHRQLSPNCPFHTSRYQVSVNDAITYEAVPLSSRSLESARVGRASSQSSATTSGLGTSYSSAAASSSASGFSTLSTSSATGNSFREVERSLAQGQATTDSIGRHAEITAQQPEENDENRDRSLLALPNTRAFRVLGRSGEDAYAHLTTPPRRNNVAVGAGTNAGLDPLQTSVATSIPTSIVSSTTSTTVHNSIFGFPIGAGAFGRSAASTQITTSTTATTSRASTLTPQSSVASTVQTSTAPASTVAGASSILRPSDPPIGGGGRTDPTITVVVDNPKHPDYRNIDDRVNSFQGWPEYLDQTPRQMSEAGFFFVGVADFTRCFCCGGGLRNWEPGDDPMLEHTRWFPRCEYVNKLKGERYVAAVQRRHQEHMEQQQREQVEAAQRRDANRNPPDPMSTETAAVLREMGYQPERIREAILTVRQRTGSPDVTTQQVLTYLLDENEDRHPPTTARQSPTDLGVKINELNLPSTTTAIETIPTTMVVNTTTSMSTESSTVSAGTNFTSAVSSPQTTKAEIQTSASTTSASSEASNKLTGSYSKEGKGNDQTGSSGKEAKGSSCAEKQSAASGGESDGEYQSAEESLTTETKSSKKKTKKKGKTKLGSKSGATGGSNIDTRTLKEENEKLREMQTCKICMERPVNTTLLPCGHLVCCDICASRLNRCPICRKRIKGTVKTFMS